METITIAPHMVWDILITLIVIPAGFLVRSLLADKKESTFSSTKQEKRLLKTMLQENK